ncbi:fimbria/pilus periplasmic chaperone [Lysobacter panacisoli]|uniref:Fimbria/pilus periplasmic chaperone n=2 Tax=Lysobacter panacisoli TaxID=1255263 RepID=A0ABP9L7K0_9GAMM
MRILVRAAFALCLAFGGAASVAHAEIQIQGTRVIYPANEREVTVKLANVGNATRLVQSWVDTGNPAETAETAKTPFTLTPPMARIEPGKGQVLRMFYTGDAAMPKDRETVFWLNVLEIPPRPTNGDGSNYMQFAVRSRIKVFFRPEGLPQSGPLAAAEQLRWRLTQKDGKPAVECANGSAYNVSFSAVGLKGYRKRTVFGGGMVPAFGTQVFALDEVSSVPGDAKVSFSVINDQGGFVEMEATLPR